MAAASVRNVVCPTCNSTYRIAESKIPANGGTATCKRCGGRVLIEGIQESVTSPVPMREDTASPADPALLEVYPDLRDLASPRIDCKEIFKPKKSGSYKSGLNRYKLKVLKSVNGLLEKVLREGERVLRIGSGTAYYPAEILFGNGYFTMLYNRYAVLGTNQRVLLINIDHRMRRPTHYLFQVPYHNLKKISLSYLFGRLTLKVIKGKNRTLTGIKRAAARELSLFLKERKKDPAQAAPTGETLENLCPSCFAPLGSGLAKCTHCEQEFKEPRKAMFRSLLLPGLGDIYLGHRFLGIVEMLGSVLVWALVILNLLAGEYIMLVFLVIFNGMDALLTHHMAKKGYMPSQG